MAAMATKLDVLPPLEEWDINLEVSSQVYQLLKGFKQLQDVTLWSDNTSLSNMGGFQNWVQENTPPGCYSSILFKKLFLPQKQITSDQRIMSITTPHSTSQVSPEVETYSEALTLKSASQHPS